MKKSNKYLFAALSAAAVIVAPVGFEAEVEAATIAFKGVLIEQNGQAYLLAMDDYNTGVGDELVDFSKITHIQLSNNLIYAMADYNGAVGDFGGISEAVQALDEVYDAAPPSAYTPGNFNSTGKIVSNGETVTPGEESGDFAVIDID